jgi:dTDP-4-dehydrorhamnose reductase
MGGEDQEYKEDDTPFPNTVYGTSLSSMEFYIQRSCLNYLILRCSPLYGIGYGPRHPNWFEVVQSQFAQNQVLQTDDTVTTGFLDIVILGKILKSAFEANVTNRLFQVSSQDAMTRFQFAQAMAKIFHKDINLVQKGGHTFPVDFNNTKNKMASHYYFKMSTNNIEEFLGTKMPTIEESLLYTSKRLARTT